VCRRTGENPQGNRLCQAYWIQEPNTSNNINIRRERESERKSRKEKKITKENFHAIRRAKLQLTEIHMGTRIGKMSESCKFWKDSIL
jgi:hypothetical protein